MLASDDAGRVRGIVLLAQVRQSLVLRTSARAAQNVSVRAKLPSRAWQSRGTHLVVAIRRASPQPRICYQRLLQINTGTSLASQVVEAAPESLRGPADASLLADFFSARLADWCGHVSRGSAAPAALRRRSAHGCNMVRERRADEQ